MNGKTAMARRTPSAPAAWLFQEGLLEGKCLDYGSGRGKDAEVYKLDAYDPYHGPKIIPLKKYDTICCTFVLNVVPPLMQAEIIFDVLDHLKARGKAYFTVRTDLKKRTETQWVVRLDPENIIHKGSGSITYEYTK